MLHALPDLAATGPDLGGLTGFSIGVIIAIVVVVLLFLYLVPLRLYFAARFAKAHVGLVNLIVMRFRRIPPALIVDPYIAARQAQIPLTTNDLETHYLAGGHVLNVVRALISADKAGIPLTFQKAAAIDLAGRDVFEAVQMSVQPRVIDAPDPAKGRPTLDAVAVDGIQLRAKARVTVRANLDRLIGGATEETIIARVGEGIVSAIGSSETFKRVLENPDLISKNVLAKGLDAQTAFEIVSIDIADVDVGDNIGAKLQIEQANADKQMAQAKAEARRALAVASEQEMRAREQEMRAKVVEAEAEVPLAIAESFRSGNLGIMDYYRLKNIQADTGMRESISKDPSE
jgi:uncharacterized protein YqfA (UPF0365 family)